MFLLKKDVQFAGLCTTSSFILPVSTFINFGVNTEFYCGFSVVCLTVFLLIGNIIYQKGVAKY